MFFSYLLLVLKIAFFLYFFSFFRYGEKLYVQFCIAHISLQRTMVQKYWCFFLLYFCNIDFFEHQQFWSQVKRNSIGTSEQDTSFSDRKALLSISKCVLKKIVFGNVMLKSTGWYKCPFFPLLLCFWPITNAWVDLFFVFTNNNHRCNAVVDLWRVSTVITIWCDDCSILSFILIRIYDFVVCNM